MYDPENNINGEDNDIKNENSETDPVNEANDEAVYNGEEQEAKKDNDGTEGEATCVYEAQSAEAESSEETVSTEPSVREYRYEEQVKKAPKKKRGRQKFIAACLIVSIAGGGSIGAGYGAVKYLFDDEATVTETPVVARTVSSNSAVSAVDIIKAVKPSVVSISTKTTGTAEYFGSFSVPYETTGVGSGVIFYSDDSRVAIATNNHVVEDADSIYVTLEGDITVPAKVVGTKSESDLAVISVSWDDLKAAGVKTVTVATFGDSENLEVGESVIAIGNAMGMGLSATDGIISMTEQTIVVDGKSLTVLQTSAAINGGNSGGALVNSAGEVIGINTAKYNSSMAEGMGYAIPSNEIVPVVNELLENGTQPTPYIGITGTSITGENASLYRLPVGALVMEVVEGGPAAEAGIEVGDVITNVNGTTILDMDTLITTISGFEIGDVIEIHVVRNGSEGHDLTLTIGDKNQ